MSHLNKNKLISLRSNTIFIKEKTCFVWVGHLFEKYNNMVAKA